MRKVISRACLPLASLCFGATLALWPITGNAALSILVPILGTVGGVIVFVISIKFNLRIPLLVRFSALLFRPPGVGLRRFAELCFSKKTFTQVLEPALSDMQKEHFEALAAGRRWQARIVLVRGYWSFWSAVAAQLPISFARRVYEVWKATKTGN
jgi:hypothetical protein